MVQTCSHCDGLLNSTHAVEWLSGKCRLSLSDGTIAVRCQEQQTCSECGQPTVLREGTGYWSPESWEAEADADRIVWDGEAR